MKLFALKVIICLSIIVTISLCDKDSEEESNYWNTLSKDALKKSLKPKMIIEKPAKNVILFIGDGMGISTITAARILKQENDKNPRAKLSFENFENIALINTANIDYITPDSAGTATAYTCGVKARKGTLGVNGNVLFESNDCESIKKNSLDSYLKWAINAGKSAGIVTTAEITDATPAATYAHSSSRNYQSSTPLNCGITDIARQLIENEPGKSFKVIFGGGRQRLAMKSKNNNTLGKNVDDGERVDMNLITKWKMLKDEMKLNSSSYKFVQNLNDLNSLNINTTEYVLGLFAKGNMKYEADRKQSDEPSLQNMTKKAIEILQKNSKGFALLVEGAKIDKAHHENKAYYSLYDTLAFDEAIKATLDMVNLNETLIIVTADHSHGFVISGYSKKEMGIFGFSDELDKNKLSYTALLYATGPGARPRENENLETVKASNYVQNSLVKLTNAAHGGEDVGAYAIGPWSHLLKSTQEQSYIAHLMAFSTCIGDYTEEEHCKVKNSHDSLRSNLCLSLLPIIIVYLKYLSIF